MTSPWQTDNNLQKLDAVCFLGLRLESSGRAAVKFNHWTTSPARHKLMFSMNTLQVLLFFYQLREKWLNFLNVYDTLIFKCRYPSILGHCPYANSNLLCCKSKWFLWLCPSWARDQLVTRFYFCSRYAHPLRLCKWKTLTTKDKIWRLHRTVSVSGFCGSCWRVWEFTNAEAFMVESAGVLGKWHGRLPI